MKAEAAGPEELSALLSEVRSIELQSQRLVTGLMSGAYRSVFRGSGIEFDEVREYVPGDDPQGIDWNLTARTGKPYIKTFVDERELTVVFVVDLSLSMDGGFSLWSLRQLAARLCACLGLSAVRNHDKVGLVAFSEEVDHFIAARQGRTQVLRILREVLALRGRTPGSRIEPALDFSVQLLRRHAVVFLISDFLNLPSIAALKRCALRHDLIAVRLLPPELSAPQKGIWRLRDPRSGESKRVDWGQRAGREAYGDRVQCWRDRGDAIFRSAQVDVLDLPLARDPQPDLVSRAILSFFRMREQRGLQR